MDAQGTDWQFATDPPGTAAPATAAVTEQAADPNARRRVKGAIGVGPHPIRPYLAEQQGPTVCQSLRRHLEEEAAERLEKKAPKLVPSPKALPSPAHLPRARDLGLDPRAAKKAKVVDIMDEPSHDRHRHLKGSSSGEAGGEGVEGMSPAEIAAFDWAGGIESGEVTAEMLNGLSPESQAQLPWEGILSTLPPQVPLGGHSREEGSVME